LISSLINPDAAYIASEDVVARDVDGELLIVPIVAGIGDIDGVIFTLNETGRAIWDRLDGNRTLRQIAASLASEYDAPTSLIEADVLGLAEELIKRRMIIQTGT
jgi:hypothetical protein